MGGRMKKEGFLGELVTTLPWKSLWSQLLGKVPARRPAGWITKGFHLATQRGLLSKQDVTALRAFMEWAGCGGMPNHEQSMYLEASLLLYSVQGGVSRYASALEATDQDVYTTALSFKSWKAQQWPMGGVPVQHW
eukprot:6458783-Amphidinium_carterae.1